jgi:hypothetical protein
MAQDPQRVGAPDGQSGGGAVIHRQRAQRIGADGIGHLGHRVGAVAHQQQRHRPGPQCRQPSGQVVDLRDDGPGDDHQQVGIAGHVVRRRSGIEASAVDQHIRAQ